MRVAIAEIKQETNTFVRRPTTLADFEAWHYWRGENLVEGLRGTNTEINGFLEILREEKIEAVPLVATFAMSGGRVTDGAFSAIQQDLIDYLGSAGELDGVLLALHGAMSTESSDAADADMLKAVREQVGWEIPIVVSLDLHANLTFDTVEQADAIVGFKTAPHVDLRETGERAARIMVDILKRGARPSMAFVKIPMLTPATLHLHHVDGPFKRLMDQTIEMESTAGALSASLFTVQPWLDIDDMGFAALAVTNGDTDLAVQQAGSLAEAAWAERQALTDLNLLPVEEAISQALAEPEGPVVLSDCADGTGAGSPGDATTVIAALLAANPDRPALVFVRDEEAAEVAYRAGVGSEVALEVGGKLDNVFNQPVTISGTVDYAGPISFRFQGEGYTGMDQDMGLSAVIRSNNVHLLITSLPIMGGDPGSYRAAGLEPTEAQIVVVKSHGQFRGAYDGIATRAIMLDTPGMSSDRLTKLPFERVPRPLYPLDPEMEWKASPRTPQRQEVVKPA